MPKNGPPKNPPFSFEKYFENEAKKAAAMKVNVGNAETIKAGMDKIRSVFQTRLLRAVERENPYEEWKQYQHGETVFEHDRRIENGDWRMTKNGIILRIDKPEISKKQNRKEFLIHDARQGSTKNFYQPKKFSDTVYHPEGVVMKQGKTLALNDAKQVYEHPDENFSFDSHPWGFIVRHGDTVTLNGNIVLFDGFDLDEYKTNENGIITRRATGGSKKDLQYEYFLNDGAYLCIHYADERAHSWLSTGRGVVTHGESEEGGWDYYLNDEKLTHRPKIDPAKAHQDGVVFMEKSQDGHRLVLNDGEVLYEGAMESYHTYKDGVVVQEKVPHSKQDYRFVYYNPESTS